MNKYVYEIELIIDYVIDKKIDWTKHCLNRSNKTQ